MEDFYVDLICIQDLELDAEDKKSFVAFGKALNKDIDNVLNLLVSARNCVINVTGSYPALDSPTYFKQLTVSSSTDFSPIYSFVKIIESSFGMSSDYFYRLLQIAKRFVNFRGDVATYVFDEFSKFSISKLKELLPLSMQQIETAFKKKQISYKSTVKQIREYVKSLKGTEKKENQVLEEPNKVMDDSIEIDYNPNEHHERDYFESLSKEELVEIVLQLQDCYESLLEDDE